jgi:peptidoglycan biosynthesis protein MviN/MurJ (putative lipid II flippase)
MILLTFWSIASRGLGALRILLVGRLTTEEADIFNAAFVLPDNIIAVFILGSITLAILPHIIELHEHDTSNQSTSNKEASYLTYSSLLLSTFIGVMTIISLIFTEQILGFLNSTLRDNLIELGRWDEYLAVTRVLLLAPLIFAVKTIFGSFLNARRKFGIYATDGVITNLGSLFGLTILYYHFGIQGAVWGVIIGFLLSAIAFGFDAFRHGLRFRFERFDGLNTYLWKSIQLYLPRLLIIPSIRIAETMVTVTTSSADGQITVLRTAMDLQGIPYALITVAAVVFLPDISTIFVKSGFSDELRKLLKKYITWGTAFSVLGFLGVTLGSPIIFWFLGLIGFIGEGSFFDSPENIQLIVICTAITSFSLVFQTIVEFYNRVYVALKNTSIPLTSSLVGNIFGIVLTLVLVPTTGAAIATAVGFSINVFIQSIISLVFLQKIGMRIEKSS